MRLQELVFAAVIATGGMSLPCLAAVPPATGLIEDGMVIASAALTTTPLPNTPPFGASASAAFGVSSTLALEAGLTITPGMVYTVSGGGPAWSVAPVTTGSAGARWTWWLDPELFPGIVLDANARVGVGAAVCPLSACRSLAVLASQGLGIGHVDGHRTLFARIGLLEGWRGDSPAITPLVAAGIDVRVTPGLSWGAGLSLLLGNTDRSYADWWSGGLEIHLTLFFGSDAERPRESLSAAPSRSDEPATPTPRTPAAPEAP